MLGPGPGVADCGTIEGTCADLSDESSGFLLPFSMFFRKALLFWDRCCTGGKPVLEFKVLVNLDCDDDEGGFGIEGLRSKTEPIKEGELEVEVIGEGARTAVTVKDLDHSSAVARAAPHLLLLLDIYDNRFSETF